MVVEQLKPKFAYVIFSLLSFLEVVCAECVLIFSLTEENIAECADQFLFSSFPLKGQNGIDFLKDECHKSLILC